MPASLTLCRYMVFCAVWALTCFWKLGFSTLPDQKPELSTGAAPATEGGDDREMEEAAKDAEQEQQEEQVLRDLHKLLLETSVLEGWLVCGNCGHEYRIKEGIANFLLPSHLV